MTTLRSEIRKFIKTSVADDARLVKEFSRRVYHNHCIYCGRQLMKRDLSKTKHPSSSQWWDTWTYDHLVARVNGGTHRDKVPCCLQCNRLKLALDVEEFRLVFFGGHGGLFWCEQFASNIVVRANVLMPKEIALCSDIGALDHHDYMRRCSMTTL